MKILTVIAAVAVVAAIRDTFWISDGTAGPVSDALRTIVPWLLLAVFEGRWLHAPARRTWFAVVTRAVLAAVLGTTVSALTGGFLVGRYDGLAELGRWLGTWGPGGLVLMAMGAPKAADRPAARPSGERVEPTTVPTPPATVVEASTTGRELLARIDRGDRIAILDVRSEEEFAAGHVPGAVNVPFTQVLSRIAEVPGAPDEDLVLYCAHGPRAYMAAAALRHAGRSRLVYLSGHWSAWQGAGLREE